MRIHQNNTASPSFRCGSAAGISKAAVRCAVAAAMLSLPAGSFAQSVTNNKTNQPDVFRQMEEVWPTPNDYRTASGAPGHEYWQQQVDYDIDVTLDDEKQQIRGVESIFYKNNSPDTLNYLWLQLDANRYKPDSDGNAITPAPSLDRVSYDRLQSLMHIYEFAGGTTIKSVVESATETPLEHAVVGTMLRINLPAPLKPGERFAFRIAWEYLVPDSDFIRARGGFEHFEKDDNYIYEVAQWFPRLCAYTDVNGWQHKQFLGSGEFTLEFGDYVVRITVPEDHIVAATGRLMNADEVLTEQQRQRLEESRQAKEPMFIVTPEEALANQAEKANGTKTWEFQADNVRDFAFASSRKFIWDAMGHFDANGHGMLNDNVVMCMSFYPNEAEPLWSRYSTHSIVHTIDVYSKFTFDYPYPVAISVNGPVYGMEYPMICFNGPRPEEDGTYSKRTKYGLISVVIHEVGHNYFPMIVNSDERQWTWMDEGLNSFLQYLAEQEWESEYPSRSGEPANITSYMKSSSQVPVMTNSESILQFGPNAYSKPATALNVLRETVLGREQFDFAFKEYSRRWMFRRPMPSDFFRTMEDASGTDLDWFWRGWFYSTDHTDVAIDDVEMFSVDTRDPDVEKGLKRKSRDEEPVTLSEERNASLPKRADYFPTLKDFYNEYDDLAVTEDDRKAFESLTKDLSDEEKSLLGMQKFFTVVKLKNVGGLVMPIVIEVTYEDDSKETIRLPAEVWVKNAQNFSKLIVSDKAIQSLRLDPRLETADVDLANNVYPPEPKKSRFQLFKDRKSTNEMQKAGLGKKPEEDEKSEEEPASDE